MTLIEFDKFIEREDTTMKSFIPKAMSFDAFSGIAMMTVALAIGITVILAMVVDRHAQGRG